MRALTVRQPWASLIMDGRKNVENRTQRTRHRGPIVLHAGARKVTAADYVPGEGMWALPLGAALGIVDIVACHHAVGCDSLYRALPGDGGGGSAITHTDTLIPPTPGTAAHTCNPEFALPDRWHWQLVVVRTFPTPIPWPGKLGMWDFPDEMIPEG